MSDTTLDTGTGDSQNVNELPSWARDAITKANNEAARYRTELRAMTDQHTAALAQVTEMTAHKDTATAAQAAAENQFLRLKVALAAGIPGNKAANVASRLNGTTEAELTEDAKALGADFNFESVPAPTDDSQGLGSDSANTSGTPAEAFAQMLKQQMDTTLRR